MASIEELLRRALALTEQLLAGAATPEEVEALLREREPLVAEAEAARVAGEPWGAAEARLARRLLLADAKLRERLWRPRAEAFGWLARRSPEAVASMPALAELASLDGPGEPPKPIAGSKTAVARYRAVRRM
jgi:hypothetical protein